MVGLVPDSGGLCGFGRTQHREKNFPPLAHLSNLKPIDPTVSPTRDLWTPGQTRHCHATGQAQVLWTRPSGSYCRYPRWT